MTSALAPTDPLESSESQSHLEPHALYSPGLFAYCVCLVVAIFLLVKAGAMVTSTGSGMAFTTWPDSDGQWLWPANAKLDGILEHGHRLIGALVGLMSLALVYWVHRTNRRSWRRRISWLFLLLVIVQGVVGGTGVWKNLPIFNSVTHGTLAEVILCLAAFIAFSYSRAWQPRTQVPVGQTYWARRLSLTALSLILLQVLMGALLRHTNDSAALWVHVGFAFVVALGLLIASAYSGTRFASVPGFTRLNRIVMTVLVLQLLLGFVTLAVRRPKDASNIEYLGRATVQSAHLVLGASLFLFATLLVAKSYRNLVPQPAGTPTPGTPTPGRANT